MYADAKRNRDKRIGTDGYGPGVICSPAQTWSQNTPCAFHHLPTKDKASRSPASAHPPLPRLRRDKAGSYPPGAPGVGPRLVVSSTEGAHTTTTWCHYRGRRPREHKIDCVPIGAQTRSKGGAWGGKPAMAALTQCKRLSKPCPSCKLMPRLGCNTAAQPPVTAGG